MLNAFFFEVFVPVFPNFFRQVVGFVHQKNELFVPLLLIDVLLQIVRVEEEGITAVYNLQ